MTHPTEYKKPTIIGIIVSPIETLRRIRERPIYWGAFFSLLFISFVLFGIIGYYQVNDPKFLEMMLKQMPQEFQTLPEPELQTTMEYLKKMNLTLAITMGGIATLLIPLMGAVLLKFIFFLIKHKKATFKQLFSFQVYLYTISVLAVFVHAITVMIANGNPEISPTSLAGVLPISNGIGKAVLLGFDIFTIWTLILLKWGLVEVTQLSTKKAWLIASLFFVFTISLHALNYMMSLSH